MDLPGVGRLTREDRFGWSVSPEVAVPALRGTTGRFVVDDALVEGDEVLASAVEATSAFLTLGPEALLAASPHVFDYYLDTVAEHELLGWPEPGPRVEAPDTVWDAVTFGSDFQIERDVSTGLVYVSVECECSWEPEHGLQLVFREGRAITKVGPYDGALVSGDGRLPDTVYERFHGS